MTPTNTFVQGKRCLFAIGSSILAFIAILEIGGLILPNNVNAWRFLEVSDLIICSTILIAWFPGVNSFSKPSTNMLVIAVIASLGFNYYNLIRGNVPFGRNYINEFTSLSIYGRFFYIFIICFLAPVSEEIYFRGLIFPIVSLHIGALAGAILSAILFFIAHMSLNVICMTILYTYLAYRSKSVFVSMLAHITYNSIWIIRVLMSQS